jgi:DNA replication protein DnaC
MSAAKPTVLLEHYLKQLRLPTMVREYAQVAAACGKERCDYPTFLLRLAERELIDREKRSAERRIKAARFPLIKTLDTFDFAAQPSVNEALVRELVTGQYIGRRENALLVGNSGTGKTHLAIALGFSACAQGRRVRFFTVTELITELLEARQERHLQRTLKQLERHDLLVLDELGYVPFSRPGADLLFEVISRAYERVSLIVTTNLPFEQWTEVCGSERLTGAILDRLTHRVHILEANGESYRLRESKRRLKKQPKRRPHTDDTD